MKPDLVPIPPRMRHLPKDRRGYPIPVMVLIDDGGRPHFQINNQAIRQQMISEDRCTICGTKLFRGRWFVGGPLAAFSTRGQYIDPPMHQECAEYALKVCPYLAAPHYGQEIQFKTMKGRTAEGVLFMEDPTMIQDRPESFVAVMAVGEDRLTTGTNAKLVAERGGQPELVIDPDMVLYVRPRPDTVRDIQVWQHGQRVTDPAALASFLESVMRDLAGYGERGRPDMWSVADRLWPGTVPA